MGMSDLYGPANEAENIATIHAALDAGITLLDTGDFYGMGHNELLLRDALRQRTRDQVVLSVKFGVLRDPERWLAGLDGRAVAVKNFLAYTLRRLGTDYVDVYRPERLDPAVPIEDTIGARTTPDPTDNARSAHSGTGVATRCRSAWAWPFGDRPPVISSRRTGSVASAPVRGRPATPCYLIRAIPA